MSHYNLSVNDAYKFEIKNGEMLNFDAVSTGNQTFHILNDNHSFTAEIASADFLSKEYTIKINNNTYVVNIQNPLDLLIKEMGFEVGAGKEVNAINAPMPGLILEINVEVGQTVAKNELLLILGAM
ncbi:MAG TPA: acetyl-CoA carboxylase biotin carboxyl carrier protein subunit, partial [Flavobacterium sp.]|nr:acetyl-CoA carboxylase biotin carboxyl carrier protein subunit [Flavobacterium sp.]